MFPTTRDKICEVTKQRKELALHKTKATYVSNRELEDLIRMETQKRKVVSPIISMRSNDSEM